MRRCRNRIQVLQGRCEPRRLLLAPVLHGPNERVRDPRQHLAWRDVDTPGQRAAVDEYIAATKRRSERDRMADTKTVSGVFTGAHGLNPVNNEPVQI